MNYVINSLLDTDFYKFSMAQLAYYYENNAFVEYHFTCRTPNINFYKAFASIQENINHLGNLKFTEDEIVYLRNLYHKDTTPMFKEGFLRFLSNIKLNPQNEVDCTLNTDGSLDIVIKGYWPYVIWYEVPILAIVSECYFMSTDDLFVHRWTVGAKKAANAGKRLHNIGAKFSEFGYFAKKYDVKPIGTMAHEWIMAHQAFTNIEKSNKMAFDRWLNFYEGNLGIALPDTLGTKHFFSIFNTTLANAFSGVRHDSGSPFEFGDNMILRYKQLDIDPTIKQIIFSDSLDIDTVEKLQEYFNGRCIPAYGIGTHFTNNVGVTPLNMVIKMVKCNDYPLIKISDAVGKTLCIDDDLKKFAINRFK